jgi:site-specific recombinase XerD
MNPDIRCRGGQPTSIYPGSPNSGNPGWKTAFLTVVRRRHYSYRTEQSYLVWLERFARFCKSDDLRQRGPEDIKAFLDDLALDQRLSASGQRQALNAVVAAQADLADG